MVIFSRVINQYNTYMVRYGVILDNLLSCLFPSFNLALLQSQALSKRPERSRLAMISSTSCSYPSTVNDSGYNLTQDPYDCRASGDAPPTYHAHGFNRARPSQGGRRSSEHIYNRQDHCLTCDDESNRGEWVYHHATHSYEPIEGGPIKQPEYAAGAQASFTDASINNTRTYNGSSFALTQYPPPAYIESVAAWNTQYYDMPESYYDQQASIESPIDHSSDQISYDRGHQLTSSSLHHAIHDHLIDDQPQRVNQPHVESSNTGMHYNLPPTASSSHPDVDVTAPSSMRLFGDPAPSVSMAVYDQTGCVDMSQSVVHSERPPLSSYSELSAHTNYYTTIIAASSESTMSSRPSVKMSEATAQSQPQSVTHAVNAWKGRSSGIPPTPSAGPDYVSANVSTPLSPPPLQTWTPLPPPSSASSKSSHRSSRSTASTTNRPVKTEAREVSPSDLLSTPPPKRASGSPVRGMSSSRSASSESRRSRTLSPSSRNQGVLKTIMMKRGGSEPKKQNLACLFCRERKIACGRPTEGSLDQTCK
ncbi:hypothetical protein M378DRAFT_367010 [Amanita muscaria Koide BX008]|uniref:Uncharacterized protein n=1 Tax=Amanita muscaria (strain Koide BX008) TaxID=946122 RepID=A0A0C2ST60_AMAMK|nr:hypothetical protein M378DRAFT_367010 [Amanita muscaria Koide BX008]